MIFRRSPIPGDNANETESDIHEYCWIVYGVYCTSRSVGTQNVDKKKTKTNSIIGKRHTYTTRLEQENR